MVALDDGEGASEKTSSYDSTVTEVPVQVIVAVDMQEWEERVARSSAIETKRENTVVLSSRRGVGGWVGWAVAAGRESQAFKPNCSLCWIRKLL